PLGTFPGRPYFVMELVKGVPLTQFCDQHRLTVPQRLELFQQICSAVQHAHQKGVIHRDLKPTNVLVESHDGRPVPKVIDFGLAKAVSELPLTDKSLFTAFGAVMGTPQYMAPEQASFNAVDVDTRADIYALGVILYELLTGSPPIPKDRLRAAALDEVLRVIREEDPPTPSHRLSTAEGVPSVAANRQTEPKKLGRLVRGDLDWIVMKALAKDRNRRYETAVGFAADVGRFLADEPVLAGPPSAGYRLRKFVRRNRAVVLATAAVLLAVLTGAGVSAWQAIRATAAEKDARESAEAESVARQQADASRREAEETAEREKAGHRRAYETIRLLTYHIRLNLGNEAEPPEERMARLLSKVLPSELNADQFFVLVKFLDYYDASPTALGNSREALELRAAMHSHAAEIRASLHDDSDAVKDRRSALALWEQVAGDNPSDAKDRLALRDANVQLADALHRASQHQDAMTYWSKAATLTQTDDTDFRYRRAKGLSLAGRVDEASAEVDVVAGEGKADDYNAACVLARASAACGEGTQRREELASRAVERLRAGVAKGGGVMFTAPFLKLDPDFDSIRDRPDFQSVYAEAVAKQRRSKGLPELVPPPREVKR
ncbi:MAG: serine/threonine protein kinase, partial [Gemmataceae bacterium]|nr:serine/threonine protein kinase [Gemmataceae bacterium]